MNHAIRLLFGAFWLVFGLNNFLHFFPIPSPSPQGGAFIGALAEAGYVFPLVFATQVLAGLLLVLNRWVPLALLLLAPVISNIVLYDLFLNPSGLAIGLIVMAIYSIMLYFHRHTFAPLLKPTP